MDIPDLWRWQNRDLHHRRTHPLSSVGAEQRHERFCRPRNRRAAIVNPPLFQSVQPPGQSNSANLHLRGWKFIVGQVVHPRRADRRRINFHAASDKFLLARSNPLKQLTRCEGIIFLFAGRVNAQDFFPWYRLQPFADESIHQLRVFRGRDVDSPAGGESSLDRLLWRGQHDDEIRWGKQVAEARIKPKAQIKLGIGEQAALEKEAGESVEVEVESAIHQSSFIRRAKLLFLFGA